MKLPLFLALALSSAALANQPAPSRPDTPATPSANPAPRQYAGPGKLSNGSQSTILHDGEHWTLVPNGAVIHLPDARKSHANVRPVGTLLPWTEFLRINRSWITTNEVTFDQAAGNEPLPYERAEFWKKQDKIVIAVHHNGPIPVIIGESQTLTKR